MFTRGLILITLTVCLAAGVQQAMVPFACAGFDDAKAAYEKHDYGKAFKEFKALAEQGNADAQFNLAQMYRKGLGVRRDNGKAVEWFRKAAEQGFVKAEYNLGAMYDMGEGVPRDNVEALKWFRMAAEQGLGEAQFNLGVMYSEGKGVSQDFVQAHMWFSLAAEQGDSEAQKDKDKVAGKMTPSQIAEAQRLANKWKPKDKD